MVIWISDWAKWASVLSADPANDIMTEEEAESRLLDILFDDDPMFE